MREMHLIAKKDISGIKTEFVSIKTKDNIILDGLLFTPELKILARPTTAVIHVHGFRGNFYDRWMKLLSKPVVNLGYGFLSMNTRNHDRFAYDAFPFADELRDFQAETELLRDLGFTDFLLLGTSLGVSRVVYYAVKSDEPGIKAIILVGGGGGFPTEGLKFHLGQERYKELLMLAKEKVKEDPSYLITFHVPPMPDSAYKAITLPEIYTAQAFIDLHGPETCANAQKYIDMCKVPILIIQGTKDYLPAEGAKLIQAKAKTKCDLVFVEGARHYFYGYEDRILSILSDWLRRNARARAHHFP